MGEFSRLLVTIGWYLVWIHLAEGDSLKSFNEKLAKKQPELSASVNSTKPSLLLAMTEQNGSKPTYIRNQTETSNSQIHFPEEKNWDECLLNGDPKRPGICRSFMDCPEAKQKWKETRQVPQRCYFEGFTEYVCCEDSNEEVLGIPIDEIRLPLPPTPKSRPIANACHFQVHPIVRGRPALRNEFPFMVALGWTSPDTEDIIYLCGGVSFNPKYVLTAAHCGKVHGVAPKIVRFGDGPLNETNSHNLFEIKRIISHPEYNGSDLYNDIALIELSNYSTHFNGACLWVNSSYPTPNVTTIGYGHTQFGGLPSNDLLKGDLFLTSNTDCSKFYEGNEDLPRGLLESQVCAGNPIVGTDTCQRDSGGPLLITMLNGRRSYVVGLTSLGYGCGGKSPGIYTKVAHYIDWIEEIVGPTEI